MKRYRSRDEIIASLLQSASESDKIGKTKMMYNSYLSYYQMTEYLDFLTNNGLLRYDKLSKEYSITTKGVKLLDLHNKMEKMVRV